MTRSEYAINFHLAAAAQRVHVGAHFVKRGPTRRSAVAPINWPRIAFAVVAAAPVLAAFIIRFA